MLGRVRVNVNRRRWVDVGVIRFKHGFEGSDGERGTHGNINVFGVNSFFFHPRNGGVGVGVRC